MSKAFRKACTDHNGLRLQASWKRSQGDNDFISKGGSHGTVDRSAHPGIFGKQKILGCGERRPEQRVTLPGFRETGT
jgi:hypothetical protein